MKRIRKRIIRIFAAIVLIAAAIFFLYCNNVRLVDSKVRTFYSQLLDTLSERKFGTNLLIISTKRFKWHNDIQVKFSGAAKDSRHLNGDAIDFIVFDVNNDGVSDSVDVEIVYKILDRVIIKNKGGVGTYKNETPFINKQMIHIDCRGYYARL